MKPRLTVLVAALATAATLLAPAPPASAAPVITIDTVVKYGYPQQVPASASGQTARVTVVVSSTEPLASAVARASATDGGLMVANPTQAIGTLAQPTTVSFDVAGATPGFHELFVEIESDDTYAGRVIPYVWTSGSPLPSTSSSRGLFRQSYGYQERGQPAQMLNIVSREFVYLGLPAFGRPRCTAEGDGCVRYWVDPEPFFYRSPLFQIGTGIVGAHHRGGFYTDGLVGRYDFHQASYFIGTRNGMKGTYKYKDESRTSGLTYEKVTFLKYAGNLVGDYRLEYAFAGGKVRKAQGTFRVDRGAITFRDDRGRIVQRGTVMGLSRALPCTLDDSCDGRAGVGGGKRGIWLILSGKKGKHPHGNLLVPIR